MTHNPRAQRTTLGAQAVSFLIFATTVAGAASLAGCDQDSGFSVLNAGMRLDPSAGTRIAFGEVVLGRTSAEPFTIDVASVGSAPLELDVRIEGDAAGAFRVSSHPRRLANGRTGKIWVRFEPTAPAEHAATLIVESNDPDAPRVEFPLEATSRDPCQVVLQPPHQTFLLGEVREVAIVNDTTSDCRIMNVLTDRRLFDFVDEPELPIDVPAGSRRVLEVQHVRVTSTPGRPVREIRVKESEGTEAVATFAGEEPVTNCFEVFPESINFPRTPVGSQLQRRVTVVNDCAREAAVTSVAMGTGFYYYSVDRDRFPEIVPPNGSTDIWITYSPFSPLGDIGRLVINTNDAANPRFEVELFGEAAIPQAQIFPRSLDFGTVVFQNPLGPTMRSECASRTQVVQIYSTGDAPLVVDGLEILGDGDQEFVVSGVLVDGQPVVDFNQPMTLPPESEMRISLVFYPTRSDPAGHRSVLRVSHNGEEGVSEVVLRGQGAPQGQVTDSFEQLEGPKVDILWVIDDSGSMYDEQARLISNLEQFVGYADSLNSDYQMAVTVTDSRSSNAGKFERCFPHPPIIRHDYGEGMVDDPTALRQQAFRCTFDVGTNGGGQFEAGLGAAMRALERAISPDLDPATNRNAGFVRPDAKLAIVVMSDEEDQSAESDDVLRDFFFSVKGSHRPDRVSVHAIAGPVAERCDLEGRFPPQPGYRYFNMTNETGGIFFNICETDWQPVLQQLGLDVFTPTDEWDLSQAADPGSLVVTVDGVQVAPGTSNGWTYNPVGNSIKFNGSAVPPPGARIVVGYSGLCRP